MWSTFQYLVLHTIALQSPVMTYLQPPWWPIVGVGGKLKVLTAPQQNSFIKRLTSDYSVYNTHSQSIQTFKKAGEGIDTQWHTYPTGRVYNKWNRTFRQPRWLNSHTHTRKNTHTESTACPGSVNDEYMSNTTSSTIYKVEILSSLSLHVSVNILKYGFSLYSDKY